MEKISVALGDRAYDVLVGDGLLRRAGGLVRPFLARPWTAIVTDSAVARLHLAPLQAALKAEGIDSAAVVLEPGEGNKSFTGLESLIDRLLTLKVERGDVVIALGGGVIGDLAGFAAAVLRRGIDFIQVPTTLLAQVDSAVGGKTAINTRHGKNLVGSFHQPRLVVADVGVLETLPKRELLAGYAEVVKYALICDADFFAWLEANGAALIAGDRAKRIHAVTASCRHKARIVAADERESGERALLNLGHTFGHALEAQVAYDDRLRHGEGVAIGLVLAFALSAKLGLCPPGDAERVRRHLAAVGLPTNVGAIGSDWRPAALIRHMEQDKKVKQGRMTFVLARGIGQAYLSRDVAEADVIGLLEREIA
jgi:3-dehydroquinate synthase